MMQRSTFGEMIVPDVDQRPLALRRNHALDTEPFAGDLFERRAIGKRLTELVERLPHGGVIAIHAEWGEGKSWFARHWNAALKNAGFPTVYLDAFEADYVEDPFLLITAELLTVIERKSKGRAENLRDGARKVASVVLPTVVKATVKAASVALTGIDFSRTLDAAVDAGVESAGDHAGELLSSAIKLRIDEFQARRESVDGFRRNLAEELAQFPRPLVFLVDELDRCKPPFAVHLLERVKHFFSVPKIVFVLLINKPQLEASVRGLYGPEVDSATYLSKFITLSLTLPAKLSQESRRSEFAQRFCVEIGKQLGYSDRKGFGDFVNALSEIAPLFRMSFRDLERAFVYYGLTSGGVTAAPLLGYICALRVTQPDLLRGLAEGGLMFMGCSMST